MTIKLPVTSRGHIIYDADGKYIPAREVAAALNAAPAPDLTALREAVKQYRAIPRHVPVKVSVRYHERSARINAVHAVRNLASAALALFPQDGDA